MSIKPPKHIATTRRHRADFVRHQAKVQTNELIAQRRYGDAYRLMATACERARDIEFLREH